MITNSKFGEFWFYCKKCTKDVSWSHYGASDLVRHCNSVTYQKKGNRKPCTNLNRFFACTKSSSTDILTRKAENYFLAEHNLVIAAVDHLSALVKEYFPDSKITKSYLCAKTKTFCILNRAIYPELQQSLIDEMIDSQHIINIKLVMTWFMKRLSS